MKKLTSKQQLKIIEGLTLLYENGAKTKEQGDIIIADIYKISHLNGTCENEHLDWHELGFELIEEFNKSGLTKIED